MLLPVDLPPLLPSFLVGGHRRTLPPAPAPPPPPPTQQQLRLPFPPPPPPDGKEPYVLTLKFEAVEHAYVVREDVERKRKAIRGEVVKRTLERLLNF